MSKIIPFHQTEAIVNLSHEQITWLDTLINQARRELRTTIDSFESKGIHPYQFATVKNSLDMAAHFLDSQEEELNNFIKQYLDSGEE